MILIISMRNLKYYDQQDGGTGLKRRFELLTGLPVLTRHYSEISPSSVSAVNPRSIIITGSPDPWPSYRVPDLYGLNDLLHDTKIPLLAICQGHQLLGHCFNRNLRRIRRLCDEPMRKCRRGEPDYGAAGGHPGYYSVDSFVRVNILRRDPVFKGLGRSIWIRESHRCEVKKLPPGFIRLAESADCACEMMRCGTRLLYGMQFHAERWQKPYFDGKTILLNFFRLALAVKASDGGRAE